MPERPLLILPTPGSPEPRQLRHGGAPQVHLPTRDRQTQRLTPRFTALQQAFDAHRARIQTQAVGLIPELVVVLVTAGPVEGFMAAVRRTSGLEWLGEIEQEDIPADDDFFVVDRHGVAKPGAAIRGRIFLVMTNQQALQQMISLWNAWKDGRELPWGLRRWTSVISQLHDVRPWGIQDRLIETGVLDDWRQRLEQGSEAVPCEIELWYRSDPWRRRSTGDHVAGLVKGLGGAVTREADIEEIAYHAMRASFPAEKVRDFVTASEYDVALVQCEQIQFIRASGQMAGIVVAGSGEPDPNPTPEAPQTLGDPVIALLDGLPLQNHERLAGRLVVDDPDNYEAEYPSIERQHGTSMASLILHGDLNAGEPPLARRIYVRPVLRPNVHALDLPRPEMTSDRDLVVDLIFRAVRRLFEGEGPEPAAAPQTCVINLSIGIPNRPFNGALSPLGRLLDWLAWRYQVLFIVSAGNHTRDIEISVPPGRVNELTPEDLQAHIVHAIAGDTRHRRLLSPAEAVNVVTVAALHQDASVGSPPATLQPFVTEGLPSVMNAQGMGYRRAVKPDILVPGGKAVLRRDPASERSTALQVCRSTSPPGQRVAAPGQDPGALGFTWHTRGTSNATALTSRAAGILYDVLEDLRGQPGGHIIDSVPRSVWLKALVVHSATWGSAGETLSAILRTRENSRRFNEYVTRLLGYGAIDLRRVRECTQHRVTVLSGGVLQADQAAIHHVPLPPSLSGLQCWRRLMITLAWLTPINSAHQAWRRAHLWFSPPGGLLRVDRQEADLHAVQRGTVQHEVLEGDRAAVFVDGNNLEVRVSCRPDAGALDDRIPYVLAITLEIAEHMDVDIYEEIQVRVHARVQITQGA